MKVIEKVIELDGFLASFRAGKKVIGFVPTMGALHRGHLSLVGKCREECDVVCASIFVNPLQFNDKSDFAHYPRTLESDLEMLENAGCDLVFVPDVNEMYPVQENKSYALGEIENVMEGKYRPGHYQGVARVVDRLFAVVRPARAYFGAKDYQQIMVIKKMIEITGHDTEVEICPTVREHDGLAMSSRNMRLSEAERRSAPAIYMALSALPDIIRSNGIEGAYDWFANYINNVPFLSTEYIQVTASDTLMPAGSAEKGQLLAIFVSVFCGKVRLIDNIFFVL